MGMSSGPWTAAPSVGSWGFPIPRFSFTASEASTRLASPGGLDSSGSERRLGCRRRT
jgi:hypothetical protein